jgi:dTDP-glucose 4,6-dehydratase
MQNPLASDLDHVLKHTADLWEELRGNRVFVTGGTGFVGCWLLESFGWANDKLDLGAEAVVLTRVPEAFRRKVPHLANHPAIALHEGDVRAFDFPDRPFSHVIHAATESTLDPSKRDPLRVLDSIVEGTRRVLDFAVAAGVRKFLLTSSGAVYGKQPPEITHLPETYAGAPDTMEPNSAYGEGKRIAELLCAIYHHRYGLETKIARCFAFVGRYLPLNSHFAIGNFIGDAIAGGPIEIKGDGTPYRSYLYAADLAIWLWTILLKGRSAVPYNVGSPHALSIAELARTVVDATDPGTGIAVAQQPAPGAPAARYVPSTSRAQTDLGLDVLVPLEQGIRRMWQEEQTPELVGKEGNY